MDAAEIRRLKPKLVKYLEEFRDCFGRSDTRGHLTTYVEGQLSKLDRKSVEPIALAAGVAPRTLQQFLNSLEWDHEQLIDTVQWRVARDRTSPHSLGLIDETSCPKKGDKTPDGRVFKDIDDYKKILLEEKEQIARNIRGASS